MPSKPKSPKKSPAKPAVAQTSDPITQAKLESLEPYRADPAGRELTTNQGVRIADNQNSLRAGERGPTMLEDFIMREKITHFDHERIPERVVHARGAAAHGFFQVYESMAEYTRAHFLSDPSLVTPVFVRFSTVGGSRGSADTPRDVRGFAVKFYTQEGNYDLVGNNMPVFFIQDAIKFPDFVHAVKPEPHNEIPQASSAHDTFWDFVSLTLESTHTVMWLMSDRALPRSFAAMEGFGVHTFRFVNAAGESRYVKFHWKPLHGAQSLVWDEAQKLMGKDADFNRRDLWESIEAGNFPEWELGVQMFGDAEADGFDFDILDPTKLIPEELVPVQRIGRMVLNRNPQSYFAETEQVAFCTAHVVPGIDFTNDPLLQGRNFSYLDTQLSRLGGPNFHEIPINRPVCPFSNGQRDGMHRMTIDTGNTAYDPNSLDEGFPKEVPVEAGGFATYAERIDGIARRFRSASFSDHFSQATLFWNSMSVPEQEHIVKAFSFELTKVTRPQIRERVIKEMLMHVDPTLARMVAENVGVAIAGSKNGAAKNGKTARNGSTLTASPVLSLLNPETAKPGSVLGRKVAILVGPGADGDAVTALQATLRENGADGLILAQRIGPVACSVGSLEAVQTFETMPSVTVDAVAVAGTDGPENDLLAEGDVVHYVNEAYKHGKPIALGGEEMLENAGLGDAGGDAEGVLVNDDLATLGEALVAAMGQHRFFNRNVEAVPA
jgi:catalase